MRKNICDLMDGHNGGISPSFSLANKGLERCLKTYQIKFRHLWRLGNSPKTNTARHLSRMHLVSIQLELQVLAWP